MSYIAAKEVLPTEIIELIQKYIEGEYIYIPKKESNRQAWGTKTSARKEITLRNSYIYNEYLNGTSRGELAEKYFLSKKSIDRIILKEKSK
ncbi:CD3324 family protein [Clostridium hydrogeniformans]|uniref:CD3324 family protein n=1 Tax=Clostridium hydrogeniformans TaxID=349933 RepID=UPI0004827F41|nr:CD3324 family protein [Clostridium hydrogeniformans]